MSFNAIEFIERKRDCGRHRGEDFKRFVGAVMEGSVPDYQISAWLMAVYLNGLDDEETMDFTEALAGSGNMLSFPSEEPVLDKHSTGGVGDKTTLVLIPLVAACGARISKLSGPGLGYTGGTVDKLASIPKMETHLDEISFKEQIRRVGCAISGHSAGLAPAEGKFYKLRDVTGTVPSIPLIVSSIISKKLAGGAHGYLFDVKCGSGAFMRDVNKAEELALKLVNVSKKMGKKCVSVISDMEEPLGEWVGNSAEVFEAIETLSGRGPSDTEELCVYLGGQMLLLSDRAETAEEGREIAAAALANGSALNKFSELITAQRGDASVLDEPEKYLLKTSYSFDIKSDGDGFLARLDALSIGEGLRALGGGRLTREDAIDPYVSIRLMHKCGESVKAGETLIRVHYNEKKQLASALPYLENCWEIKERAEKRKLIIETIG